MPDVGELKASIVVGSAEGVKLADLVVTIRRDPPDTIEITIGTRPIVEGAVVRLIDPDTGDTVVEATTNAGGSITEDVRYGEFHVVVEHPEYERIEYRNRDTGTEPSKSATVQMTAIVEPVDFVIVPPDATVLLQREGEPRPRTVDLDESGKAQLRLPFGDYLVNVEGSDEYKPQKNYRLEVARNTLPVVRIELRKVLVNGDPIVLTRSQIMRLNSDEFVAYIRKTPAPLVQLEITSIGRQHLIKGPVYDQEEHDNLVNRLKPAKDRLMFELTIDENAVESALKDALIDAGADAVDVQTLSLPNKRLWVYFRPTADCTSERCVEIAKSFLLNDALLELRERR
jgi:hypothetical protein